MKIFLLTIAFVFASVIGAFSQNFINASGEQNFLHQFMGGEYGGGVSFADWDKDGWDDLTICQNNGDLRFFHNTNGQFEEYPAFFTNTEEAKMATWVDYDNDGDRDFFVTFLWDPFRLFRNDGNWLFTEVTADAGLPQTYDWMTYGHSWGDYNNDSFPDLYISNYNGVGFANPTVTNHFYENNGDGTFTDKSLEAGIDNGSRYTFMGLWMDYDHNGWQDLWVVNDRTTMKNYLYRNNGNGTFLDITEPAGVGYYIFSMNAAADDYDNDGDMDMYVTNNPSGNLLHQNQGDGTFIEVAEAAGVEHNDHSWAAHFFDFDNDTFQDLFVSTSPFWLSLGQNDLYHNLGNGTFENYTDLGGFTGDDGWSHSSAIGDYNNDGFFDLAVVKDAPDYSRLWRCLPTTNNYLKVILEGTLSNKDGIGSWITCWAGGNKYTRYVYCGEGYMSQNSYSEIFGLGEYETVDTLTVEWLSGVVDNWYNLDVNQTLNLQEGSSFEVNVNYTGALQFCEGDSVIFDAGIFDSYLWSDNSTDRYLTANESGQYSVEVVSEFGFTILSEVLEVTVFETPVVAESATDVTCYGYADGSISLYNETGIAADSVSWSNGLAGDQLYNLSPGEYSYTYTDVNECSVSGVVAITQPDSLYITCELPLIPCNGFEVLIDCDAWGGTPPYEFNIPDSLVAGVYDFLVTDTNGCAYQTTITLEEPAPLVANLTTADESLANGPGSASVDPQGGTPPYDVQWSNSDSGNSTEGLLQGFYAVTITDANGCELTELFEIGYNGIDELQQEVRIYPNPAHHEIFISSTQRIDVISIFDSAGNLIREYHTGTTDAVIDVAAFSPGLYCIVLRGNPFLLVEKLEVK